MTSTSVSYFSVIAFAVLGATAASAKETSTVLTLSWPGPSTGGPAGCEILNVGSSGRHAIVSKRGGAVRLHADPAVRDASIEIATNAADACVLHGALPGSDVGFVADVEGVRAFVPDAGASAGFASAPVAEFAHLGIQRIAAGALGLDGSRALFALDAEGVVHVVAVVPTPGEPLGLDYVPLHTFVPVGMQGAPLAIDALASIDWDGDPSNQDQLVMRSKGTLVLGSMDGTPLLERTANDAGTVFAVVREKSGVDALVWTAIDALGRRVLRLETVFGADVDVLLGPKFVRALCPGDKDGDGDDDLLVALGDGSTLELVTNASRADGAAPSATFAQYGTQTSVSGNTLGFDVEVPYFATPAFGTLFDDWSPTGAPVLDVAMPIESSDVIELRSLGLGTVGGSLFDASHPAFGASQYFASSVAPPSPPPLEWDQNGHLRLTLHDAWPTLANKSHIEVIVWYRDVNSPYIDELALSDTFHAIGPAAFPLDVVIDIPEIAQGSGGNWNGYFEDIYYFEVRAVRAFGSSQSGYTILAAGRSYILGMALDETPCDTENAPVTSLELLLTQSGASDPLANFCYSFACGASSCGGAGVMTFGSSTSTGAVAEVRVPCNPLAMPRVPVIKKTKEVNPPVACATQ